MAYIGKTPTIGNFQKCDAITVVNGQAAYTMQVGGTNVSPESENHMLVSLNGILQAPVDSFTISGSTITFASNLATGDVIDFIMLLGNVLDLGVPSDNTVSLAKLTATGTKSSSTFLRGDNTFATISSGLSMADQWRITANKTISSGTSDVTANWEQVDTDGGGFIGSALTESSGIFSFPSTGIYLIIAQTSMSSGAALAYAGLRIQTTTNNSTYDNAAEAYNVAPASGQNLSANTSFIFDVTDITQDKFKLNVQANASCTFEGETSISRTGINVIRLGDT